MGEELLQQYTALEVIKTPFQMAPLKSPGPDGVHLPKSSVVFSRNTGVDLGNHIVADLTIRRENKMELYLDLPSRVAHFKRNLFTIIRDRIWCKIIAWDEKFLSQADKEVLIKSVIQAPLGWQAPLADCVKINSDGATSRQDREMGIRVIAQGAPGEYLAWLARHIHRLGNGEVVEALAARETISLAS
ncbi:UNVERIFIED_CONTAM: hypothetical protein Scaly_2757400 [Sesamum calycinum]|uniref:Uncharacterized protein n=1 Tax=Sesamum calycinum TaxID=2727403 RepID=A0AAW2IZF5_9LAMI